MNPVGYASNQAIFFTTFSIIFGLLGRRILILWSRTFSSFEGLETLTMVYWQLKELRWNGVIMTKEAKDCGIIVSMKTLENKALMRICRKDLTVTLKCI